MYFDLEKRMNTNCLYPKIHLFFNHKCLFLLYKILCHCKVTYWNTILEDVTI